VAAAAEFESFLTEYIKKAPVDSAQVWADAPPSIRIKIKGVAELSALQGKSAS
jgi:hypothetical protein